MKNETQKIYVPVLIGKGAPTADRYKKELTSEGHKAFKADERTKLIPLRDCNEIVIEMKRALAPVTEEQANKLAKILIGSYPVREVNDADIFIRAIKTIFEEFPLDIGKCAVDEITKQSKWSPTRAEVYQACLKMSNQRKQAIRIAEEHKKEHERRKIEAKNPKKRLIKDMSDEEKEAFFKKTSEKIARLKAEEEKSGDIEGEHVDHLDDTTGKQQQNIDPILSDAKMNIAEKQDGGPKPLGAALGSFMEKGI